MSDTLPPPEAAAPPEALSECPSCRKPAVLCVCDQVQPIATRLDLLILQHPQEQDKTLGTARLAALHPLGRMGEPEENAHMALFLRSDQAQWITGHWTYRPAIRDGALATAQVLAAVQFSLSSAQ